MKESNQINIEESSHKVNSFKEGIELVINWLSEDSKEYIRDLTPYSIKHNVLHFSLNLTIRNFFIRNGSTNFKDDYANYRTKYSGFNYGEIGECCFVDYIWRELKGIHLSKDTFQELDQITGEITSLISDNQSTDKIIRLMMRKNGLLTSFSGNDLDSLCNIVEKEVLVRELANTYERREQRQLIRQKKKYILAKFTLDEISLFEELTLRQSKIEGDLSINPEDVKLNETYSNLKKKKKINVVIPIKNPKTDIKKR